MNGYEIGPGVDLSGADLSGADLSGVDLQGTFALGRLGLIPRPSGINLTFAKLTGANLSKMNFCEATFWRAEGQGADFWQSSLHGADLREVDFCEASFPGADLSGADLSNGNFSGADLKRSKVSDAHLIDTDLSGIDASWADFKESNFAGANLSGADLYGANLSGANLSGANLSGANLSGANLLGADLSGANLSGANLSGANLTKKQLAQFNSVISVSSGTPDQLPLLPFLYENPLSSKRSRRFKRPVVALFIAILIAGIAAYNVLLPSANEEEAGQECSYVSVRYRTNGRIPICDNTFSTLPNTDGQLRRAYFDAQNNYMIVNLSGTNYHYCRFPNNVWREWSNQSNKYTYYVRNIRGNYDCRDGGGRYVPDY